MFKQKNILYVFYLQQIKIEHCVFQDISKASLSVISIYTYYFICIFNQLAALCILQVTCIAYCMILNNT